MSPSSPTLPGRVLTKSRRSHAAAIVDSAPVRLAPVQTQARVSLLDAASKPGAWPDSLFATHRFPAHLAEPRSILDVAEGDDAASAPVASRGRRTTNTVPCPSPALLTRTVPPWSWTSCFTIASPRPNPACLRFWK